MFTVPPEMVAAIAAFAPVFSQERVWLTAQTLLVGTILAHGRRTVTAALRAAGLSDEKCFTTYHRLLNRVRWRRMLASSRTLLSLLVAAFVPAEATIVVAIDDFIERRHSNRLFGLGSYRDPVRSSATHQVTCFGVRWLVASVCVSIPGARRVWALPFLSTLCLPPEVKTRKAKGASKQQKPTRRGRTKRGGLTSRRRSTAKRPVVRTQAQRAQQKAQAPRRHKTTIDVAAQVLSVLSRWLGARRVVAVLDGAYFSYKLLRHAVEVGVGVVTRGRWAMVLYGEPAPRARGAKGPAPSRGKRIGSLHEIARDPTTVWEVVEIDWYGGERKRFEVATGTGMWSTDNQKAIRLRYVMTRDLEPDAKKRMRQEVFVSTEVEQSAEQILQWYVWRWSEEVTFEESRRHLGVETGRGWTRPTLQRSTPALLGVFSIVTLVAVTQHGAGVPKDEAAWYRKSDVTFSDCLACVRRQLWRARYLQAVGQMMGGGAFSATVIERLLDALPLSA